MYLGNSPNLAVKIDFEYLATEGQTTFTGGDVNGLTLSYNINNFDVYVNGVLLARSDFTATSASSLELNVARNENDLVIIRNYGNIEYVDSRIAGKANTADVDGKVVLATKTGNYTALTTDNNAVHRYTATATVNLTAAATLGANWHYTIVADGGNVTVNPNASETIDGDLQIVILNGYSATIYCDGTNFKTDLGYKPRVQKGHINGLTISNATVDAVNDIEITAGECASSDAIPVLMHLNIGGSLLTKALDAAWALGDNAGGLDTGTVADGTYHVYVIRRPDNGIVDACMSASASAPTTGGAIPAEYTQYRRIGSIIREGGAIVTFKQYGNVFKRAPIVDRSSVAAVASTAFTIAVPSGITIQPLANILMVHGTAGNAQTQLGDIGGAVSAVCATALAGQMSAVSIDGGYVVTNRQIQFAVVISGGTLSTNTFTTRGWIDERGQG